MKPGSYICLSLIVFAMLLLSCESNFKDVQRINSVAFSPSGETEDINLKYTDSGKVKAILVSPLMLDFSNLEYGFNEFPKGVHVTLYDEQEKTSTVVADYAIRYEGSDIIDLQGNVKITAQGCIGFFIFNKLMVVLQHYLFYCTACAGIIHILFSIQSYKLVNILLLILLLMTKYWAA